MSAGSSQIQNISTPQKALSSLFAAPRKDFSTQGRVWSRLPDTAVFEVGETVPELESVGTRARGGGRGGLSVPVVQGHMTASLSWKSGLSEASARAPEGQAEKLDLGWGTREPLSGV